MMVQTIKYLAIILLMACGSTPKIEYVGYISHPGITFDTTIHASKNVDIIYRCDSSIEITIGTGKEIHEKCDTIKNNK